MRSRQQMVTQTSVGPTILWPRTKVCAIWVYLGGGILIMAAAQWYLWNNTADDAFILFRYVARFVQGHGLTFNPGERVEGYSCPLWMLLVSFLTFVTSIDPPLIARLAGICCEIGIFFLSWHIFRRTAIAGLFQWTIAIWGTLIFLTPGFHYFAGAGLETPLLEFLLVMGVWFASKGKDGRASVTFGLAGITRPEGILFIAAWLAWKWFFRNTRTSDCSTVRAMLLSLVFVAGWEVFRVSYYGSILPNTGIAKYWQGFGDFGFAEMARFCVAPIVASAFLLLAHRTWEPVRFRAHPIFVLCTFLTIAGAIFVVYAVRDWMFFGRYVLPFFPIAMIGFSLWISSILHGQKEFFTVLAILAVAQLLAWEQPVIRYATNEGFAILMKSSEPIRAAKWIHSRYPAGTTLATDRLGAISYIDSDFIIWDFAGLTDLQEALHRKSHNSGPDPILIRRPRIIAETNVPEKWNYRLDSNYFRWLTTRYRLIGIVPQGNFGSLDFWERK
jgi:arabinofuranosyltransferase